MKQSLEAGKPVRTVPSPSLADALTVPQPGANTFAVIRRLVEDVLLIGEDGLESAIRTLAIEQKLVAEAGGAASVAAALEHAGEDGGDPIVCVISGGNIAPADLRRILANRS